MYRTKAHSPLEVVVERGSYPESIHTVHAVVVDSKGETVAAFGDENLVTYPRSAIKMLQAFLLYQSGALEKLALSQCEIALACASHKGEPLHVDLVRAWHQRVGLQETDLICGPHLPFDEESAHSLNRKDEKPCRYHNNCSGKHSGILSSLLAAGQPIKDYQSYDHWAQVNLRKLLGGMSGLDMDKAPWGWDGCGIPTYAMSVKGMAKAMSTLLGEHTSADWNKAAQVITEAVTAEPYCVSGKNSFCTEVISLTQGRSIIKAGAEGLYCGIMREKGLAYAIKVQDGAYRAVEAASAAILGHFGGLTESEMMKLSRYTRPVLKNWAGIEVGKVIVRNLKTE